MFKLQANSNIKYWIGCFSLLSFLFLTDFTLNFKLLLREIYMLFSFCFVDPLLRTINEGTTNPSLSQIHSIFRKGKDGLFMLIFFQLLYIYIYIYIYN
jgi:hypothetical protein